MATAQITPDQDAILAEIFIAAPPVRVFEAIADVNQRAQWWGMKGVFHVIGSTSDLRPGGKWSHDGVGPTGQKFHMEGEYLEVEPPRLLVHTRQADFVGTGLARPEQAPEWQGAPVVWDFAGFAAAQRRRPE